VKRLWPRQGVAIVEQTREELAHVARRIEMTRHALRAAANGKCKTVVIRHDRKHRFVRDVVADEQGLAALEWGVCHQFAHAARLGETGMLDLADAFSGQHFDRRVRQIGADQRDRFIDRLLGMRRQAIMQRQRIALVLQQIPGLSLATAASRRFNS